MRHETDPSPLCYDTGFKIACMEWSCDGVSLAVAGKNRRDKESKMLLVAFLKQLPDAVVAVQSLRVPGKDVTSLAWRSDGLSLALTVDSYVFFATIRPDYKWDLFDGTLVYEGLREPSHADADMRGGCLSSVVFWHIKTDERSLRPVKGLIGIAASDDRCVVVSGQGSDCCIALCNSRGVPIAQQELDFAAKAVTMTSSLVIAISNDCFVVWRFKEEAVGGGSQEADTKLQLISIASPEEIACQSSSEKLLALGLASCRCLLYKLPDANQVQAISLQFSDGLPLMPIHIFLSSDGQRVAAQDSSSRLVIHDIDSNSLLDLERRDVWSFRWCIDQPSCFAMTERSKMLIYRDAECEESVPATGYIASFRDLTITTVRLDKLLSDQESDQTLVMDTETKTARDVRALLTKEGGKKAEALIERSPHPRLWRMLADHAMRGLDFAAAEAALVRCKDYKGIQFCKKLSRLTSEGMKRAGVYAFFGELDEAEKVYLDLDRRDLAVEMRRTMGQYDHVLHLMSQGPGMTSDAELKDTMRLIGDHYADMMQYEEAVKYYESSDDFSTLFQTYLRLEDYESLTALMKRHTPERQELISAAETFESVGMCEEAVDAFLAAGQVRDAIRCCVSLNSWQTALSLAQEHEISDTDALLSQYAAHLLQKEKYFDIVELYKKAGRLHDASSMILKVIEDLKRDSRIVSCRLLKQLHCLIGMLHSQSQEARRRVAARDGGGLRRNTLTSLLRDDESLVSAAVNFRAFDSPWKGCEACHFYLLAHKHLYGSTASAASGSMDDAMKCAHHLQDYEEFLNLEDIYALIALTACGNRNFALASKAFMKLETMSEVAEHKRKQYSHLATDIFARHPPKESRNVAKHECSSCSLLIPDYLTVCPSCNTRFPTCVATGRPIVSPDDEWTCDRCRHSALKSEISLFNNCPLCHLQVPR